MHTMTNRDTSGLYDVRPILSVDNVTRSIHYYVGALGFRLAWAWSTAEQRFLQPGEEIEIGFALVGRGPIQFMLSHQSQGAPGMWLHLDVDTAEQLDALQRASGKWPEYPKMIMELARNNRLQVPGWTLPGAPQNWDRFRAAKIKKR